MSLPGGPRPSVASVVLAAGGSRRFGRAKLTMPLGDGRPVLAHAVVPHLEAGVSRVVVVVGSGGATLWAAHPWAVDPRVVFVVNERWEEGMASSLRAGVTACGDAEAALVALGDQPGMSVERIEAVLSAGGSGAPLVVPTCEGHPVHPVLFSRALFPELLALRGDVGGRSVVTRHWEAAVTIEVPALPDIDTETDYRALIGPSGILPS